MINVSSNAAPMSASLTLARTSQNLKQSITRLSSGLRINSSFDDPAGVAVSARFNNKVLKSAALGQNLGNTLSFLETQEAYLRRLGDIYIRIQEIEIQKQDVIKKQGDISIYDTEKSDLIAEIYQIRDEKFNGVRLFSPDSDMDSMNADTQAINNASEVVQQPPLIWKGENKPLELVFLCDYTGSMRDTREGLINNINTFAADLNAKVAAGTIPSWKARVIVFGDWNSYNNNNFVRATSDFTNPASSDAIQIKTQTEAFAFPMRAGIIVPGQNNFDESPIDAIGYAVNNTTWSPDSNRGMILFTDHGSQPPNGSFGSSLDIANAVKNQGVNLFIYGDDDTALYPNEELMTFVGQSEANFSDFANSANMSSTLNNFIQSVLGPEEIIDFDTLAQYIALNGAKQNRIRNLIDSNALLKNHAAESLGEIRDLDIAAESIKFNRLMLLQDAGTAYIAQSNVAMNHSLFNLLL